MSDQKMGTHYAREMAAVFREMAGQAHYGAMTDKLEQLADELEKLASKLYFKTQKGTEDMQRLMGELEELRAKAEACQEASEVGSMCTPFFGNIEKVLNHVKTMKVRMT
ncbi:MAG: hypothetical protein D6708_13445 [Candidatus Dadabacteria bacterium]|nr:MAG: hypothetical protein D6708_13445 [Candidatus Dadabacteria bacterium]